MIDPGFYEDVDPDFFFDTAGEEAEIDDAYREEYIYDTYDRIFDGEDLFKEEDPNRDENGYDWDISGAEMGLMGALAAEMSEDARYDVDEKTDQENWEKVMKLTASSGRCKSESKLRPFEQYVQTYLHNGCKHPDDD